MSTKDNKKRKNKYFLSKCMLNLLAFQLLEFLSEGVIIKILQSCSKHSLFSDSPIWTYSIFSRIRQKMNWTDWSLGFLSYIMTIFSE